MLLRAASKNIKAKGSDGIVSGEILKDLGCVNIADSDSSLLDDLSLEAIVKEDPDFIFVIIQGTNTEAALKNVDTLLKSNPVWNSLTAVKMTDIMCLIRVFTILSLMSVGVRLIRNLRIFCIRGGWTIMAYFPFYVELKDVSVLIVGGGKVALHKVKRILDYGPKIKVVAKKLMRELKILKVLSGKKESLRTAT